ncbi:hypothetical protein IU427_26690 [Nocardia beijingensis]|uniref:hypothetical protein n=1 Tax=Nocardia beijingensis TaxID=95162 RepID=UPI001892F9B2|nr:hypothetical protein [Nocardia beijingensis]MBF6468724.1 hypothetical protein [Nocardia beijingensis]
MTFVGSGLSSCSSCSARTGCARTCARVHRPRALADETRSAWARKDSERYSRPTGAVLVQFDPPIRDFCHILIGGGASGQDLYDQWWRDAPLSPNRGARQP